MSNVGPVSTKGFKSSVWGGQPGVGEPLVLVLHPHRSHRGGLPRNRIGEDQSPSTDVYF